VSGACLFFLLPEPSPAGRGRSAGPLPSRQPATQRRQHRAERRRQYRGLVAQQQRRHADRSLTTVISVHCIICISSSSASQCSSDTRHCSTRAVYQHRDMAARCLLHYITAAATTSGADIRLVPEVRQTLERRDSAAVREHCNSATLQRHTAARRQLSSTAVTLQQLHHIGPDDNRLLIHYRTVFMT